MPAKTTNPAPGPPAEPKQRQMPVILGPIIIIAILAVFWLPQVLSNAAAVVNGESISNEELDRRVAFERVWAGWNGSTAPTSGREAVQFRAAVLDNMIESRLVLQEAKKVGILALPAEINDKSAQIRADLGLSDAQINASLTDAGLTRQTFDNVMREDVLVEKHLRFIVLKDTAQADQQTAVRNWLNNTLSKANIERRIESGGAKVGQPAPDFTLNDLEGNAVRLSDLKGKGVFINFWATWCNPCRAEMPDIEAVWKANKDKGLVVLAVNLTNQDDVEAVKVYMKDMKLSFPALLDTKGSVASLYRVGPIPSSYFVNREGVLTSVQVGAMSRSTMETRINRLLQ